MIFLAQNVYSIVDDNEKFAKRAFRCMTFCIKRELKTKLSECLCGNYMEFTCIA